MFSKLGRNGGTGRGSGNRPLSTPSQLHRPGEGSVSRPPIGASGPLRARPGAPSIAVSLPGREETFSLEPGALDFGAIIRLTPDIVKEIKRLEAHGGSAKIKFDENANNSAGNVVEVDGKEFRFTWSRELTDLCDIYEERQNGDHGDGLLVECGAAWRKLNVQRILDESTKNHVKMRSEEAERMLKSRKAIVLDPTNPSVKNQAKSMAAAAVEGNMRRMGWKHKKEMFSKKNKVENNQGAAALSQSKSVSKSATASKSNSKGIPSPVLSPHQPQPITLLSSSGTGKTPKGDTNSEAITPLLTINKEEVDIIVKEMPTGFGDSIQEINGYKERNIDPLIDLESMLITLLSQNPRGMSLKALEKAVGETVANPAKKIENALKNIATLQTPGRYFLKQGRHVESSTRSSEGGSSPECSHKKVKRAVPVLFENAIVEKSDQGIQSLKNEKASDPIERIDVMQITGDQIYVEVKDKENSVRRAGSCSDSESDSDSDSSSSGSDSGSQSKSKAGSGSASCSDSESDRTSSSKEASDMDVDIMISDDEKGVAVESMDAMVSGLSPRTRLWRSDGEHNVDTNEIDQKANDISVDLHDSENLYEMVNLVTDTKILPRSAQTFEKLEAKNAKNIDSYLQQAKSRYSVVYQDNNKVTQNQHESPFGSFDNDRLKITGRQSVIDEQTLMKAGSQQLYNHENVTKINTKRSSNSDHHVEKSQNAKRMKASSSAEGSFRKGKVAHSSHGSSLLSSDIAMQMDQKIKVNNSNQRDERRETNLLDEDLQEHAGSAVARNTGTVQSSPDFGGPSNFSAEKSGQKVVDSSGRKRNDMEKPIKHVERNRKVGKHLQTMSASPETDISALKNMQVDRISTMKGKLDEDGDIKDKYLAKNAKEIITGERISSAPDLVNAKPTDGYVNENGNFLRRESSDLELGEFREPLTHVMREDKRPSETKNSFKKVENKVALLDSKIDINMNKCDGIGVSEAKKQSPPILRGRMDGKVSADGILDVGRSNSRFMQSQYRQTSRMDVTDLETTIHLDSCAESGGKTGTSNDHVMGVENEACALMKTTSTRTLKDDNRHGALVGRKNVKESKTDKLSGLKRSTEHDNYGFTTSNGTNSRKSMKFSSDEENIPSIKYKNAALDLRGPIKDLSMYKDYVQEYQEKYSHYFSLNKKLDKIRNDFLQVGDNLELARGRNMEEYYVIVEKLRQMYRQHGEGHKEMKRIYILLHEELKTLKQRIKDFVAVHSRE